MKKGSIIICVGMALVFLLALPAAGTAAQKPIKLVGSSHDPEDLSLSMMEAWYYKAVEKRSGGKIKIEPHWAGTLAKGAEELKMTGSGAIDICGISSGYYPGELPLNGLPNVGRLVDDATKLNKALYEIMSGSSPLQKALEEEFLRNNLKFIAWKPMKYQMLTVNPIKTAADLKGLKLRSVGIYEPKVLESFGAIPVAVMPAEWYESMSRGTINGMPAPFAVIAVYKLYEVAKYATFNCMGIGAAALTINLDRWNSFSPEIQKAFAEKSFLGEVAKKWDEIWKDSIARDMKVMDAAGVQFLKVDPAEQQKVTNAYRKVAMQVYPAEMEKIGKKAEAEMFVDAILTKVTGKGMAETKKELGIK